MQNSSQQFCVKWNSYSSNLQNVFPRLLTSEHFVDITLACEGQMIKCHKVVLSACSTYFENLLVQNPCQHPIVFMKDMKHWEVQALVDFMYKGEVNVSQDELDSLLVAAEALQIRGLCSSDQSYVGNQQEQSQSDQNRIHTVTLPHDTILSGRESPPQKRRRNMTEDQSMPSLLTDSNRANLVPTSTSSMEVSALPLSASVTSSQVIPSKSEAYGDQLEKKKGIKQEVDFEDCYIEGDGVDGDGPDDDYSIERQGLEDSDSKEDGLSASKMGQPGPSGLTNSGIAATNNKAPTELTTTTMVLQNVACILAGNDRAKTWKESNATPTRIRRSEAELTKAAECVQKGMTFQNVSDIFNIPISTIRFYMARRGILPQRRRGRTANSQQPNSGSSQYMVMHYKLDEMNKSQAE